MLSEVEIRRRLFNVLFEIIMPKLYTLQESPIGQEQALAVVVANALYRLYGAIIIINKSSNWHTFCGKAEGQLSEARLEDVELLSIDDMLDRCFFTYNSAETSYQPNPSLRSALNNNVPYGCTVILKNTLEDISSTNFKKVLQENGRNNTLMHSGVYSSIVTAKKLCALVRKGDLEGIKGLNFSTEELDLVIDMGWTALTDKMTIYLGRYNALAVAVWYRHYSIIQYFISVGANVNKKVGRNGDVAISACAGKIPFFSEPYCSRCHEFMLQAEFENPDRSLVTSDHVAHSMFRPPITSLTHPTAPKVAFRYP